MQLRYKKGTVHRMKPKYILSWYGKKSWTQKCHVTCHVVHIVKSIRIWTGSGFLSCSKQVSLSCPRSDRHLTGAWMMADEANDMVRSNLLWTNLIKKFQRTWWRVWSWLWTTGCSWGLFTRLNGGTSCTSVLPELMSYLSMRFVRAVKNLPEYNSAEDIDTPENV